MKNTLTMSHIYKDPDDAYFTPVDDDDDYKSSGNSVGTVSPGTFSGTITGSGGLPNIPSGSNSFTTSGGITWAYNAASGITASNVNTVTVATTFVPKSDILYVIVFDDGSCIELCEQNPISPREMINICKFINLVTQFAVGNIEVDWEEFIDTLNIRKHFITGNAHYTEYDMNTNVNYIILHSS